MKNTIISILVFVLVVAGVKLVYKGATPPEMDRAVEFCIDKFVLVEGS